MSQEICRNAQDVQTLNPQKMVGERFPKHAQEGRRKFPGTLQDFETLNPQKMVGERFPKQELRQEALTTRYQEALFSSCSRSGDPRRSVRTTKPETLRQWSASVSPSRSF